MTWVLQEAQNRSETSKITTFHCLISVSNQNDIQAGNIKLLCCWAMGHKNLNI